jgi:AraC family transcriptional regulator of adaptative response / DNA-3-methyladenine glycosylase II
MKLDTTICYRALQTRDRRFDGKFFTAVRTTGIYCRPVCPARTPKLANCLFLPSAAAAHQLGFRPCLRCRPEMAPGLGGYDGADETVRRALGLILDGALDDAGVAGLAARLGVTDRHLRRLFVAQLGASPVAVAQAHRVLFAKKLLTETDLPITEVAFASGFGSLRRFNAVMRQTFGRAPRDLRRERAELPVGPSQLTLRLPFRPPYNWAAIVRFLRPRAIPGVEWVDENRYLRTFALPGSQGYLTVQPIPGEEHLAVTIQTSSVAVLPALVGRIRRLFDLDTDLGPIERHLAQDPLLQGRVTAQPGLRVPGAWDGFELAVRAILGQQVSVAAATTLAGRLVAAYGDPLPIPPDWPCSDPPRLFPTPERLANADLRAIGLPAGRAAALAGLAAAVAADPDLLSPHQAVQRATAKLLAIPGIGPWTVAYIAMRALRDADAFPESDLGLLRAVGATAAALRARAEAWRPWRAYAALHLWLS